MGCDVQLEISNFQDDFINSEESKVAIVGAKGSSKTWTGARFLLTEITKQPNVQHLVMLNTLQQARDVYYQDIEPLLDELGWPYHFNAQYMNLRVFNTTVHFRSAEKDAIQKIESIHYGSGWADEVSFYDSESLKIFFSRIRKGDAKVRVTSMPDEPDHWMYELLENAGFKLYEISLYDNPDKGFVDKYVDILKSFYSDRQLKRYLSGERVSLAGHGIFHILPEMKKPLHVMTDEDIYLMWDFNVEYRAVSAWQRVGTTDTAYPIIGCVKSWQMKKATIYEDADYLADYFKNHRAHVYLGGDATEKKRSVQVTESVWMGVRRSFREAGIDIRNSLPSRNPDVKDTIQCANWALRQNLVIFDENEKNVFRSVSACKADKFGEIDKSGDDKPSGAKTHEADTFRYATWYFFNKLYPGGKNRIWVI